MNIKQFFSYYTPNNRAVVNGFYPIRTSDGRENPIGRATFSSPDTLVVFPLHRAGYDEYLAVDGAVRFDDLHFKPEYQASPEVWRALVNLHDHEEFWDMFGLNESGRAYLDKVVYLHKHGEWPDEG